MNKKIMAVAHRNGYKTVKALGSWNGYDIYYPIMGEDAIVGFPIFIMSKSGKLKWSNEEETDEIMKSLF